MAKKIKAIVKLRCEAGKANPAPPVGQVLGPFGIATQEFCQQFNDQTQNMMGWLIPAKVTIYEDRSFSFVIKQPPTSDIIKRTIGLDKGSGVPNKQKVGKITKAQLREVAEKKMPDLNAHDIEAAMAIVGGTARNMGVEVVD